MGTLTLNDILVTPLRRIPTTGGDVMHGMKSKDPGFEGFGEAYFSWVNQGAVKGWKKHTKMTMNVVVPIGIVRFVFFIDGEYFRVEDIGEHRYARLTVPPGIWCAFQGVGSTQNLVLNLASIMHDPDEAQKRDLQSVNYTWD